VPKVVSLGNPPALPGDSQSLTGPAKYESLLGREPLKAHAVPRGFHGRQSGPRKIGQAFKGRLCSTGRDEPLSHKERRALVAGLQHGARETTAALDVDATLVESHKDAATVAYDGTRGYQPVPALWAEQDVIVHDQFRDGHVPASCGNLRVLQQAVANLPQGIMEGRLRADSARFETEVLRWCEETEPSIAHAISADHYCPNVLELPKSRNLLMVLCVLPMLRFFDLNRRPAVGHTLTFSREGMVHER
jgi:hypothetical protein